MLLTICVIAVVVSFSFSPALGAIATIVAAYFLYGSFKRTMYMTDSEVDIANNLKNIKDPNERKRIKSEIQRNIDQRIVNKQKPWKGGVS